MEPSGDAVKVRMMNFSQTALDAIHYRLVEGGNRIRNKMINSMRRTPRTGRRYKVGKNRYHIASSPGNAPAINTGNLLRSLKIDDGIDYVEVGSTLKKIPTYLERGTLLMEPRPFMEPAAKAEIPRIRRKIRDDLARMKL